MTRAYFMLLYVIMKLMEQVLEIEAHILLTCVV